jgi:hypothetical protein
MIIVGLYLPSLQATRISFLRAILRDEKKALKLSDIVHLNIPYYEEISVRNMYEDAMQDPKVSLYLPTKE